jgi:hypothetical protein
MVSCRPPFHRLQRVQKRRLQRPCDHPFAPLRATGASLSSPSAVITGLNMEIDGLQINNQGNLIAIDAATGAKLINLGTGALGTVTNLTDGVACATTVAIYKADAWCSDAAGAVIRLVGAGDL